MATAKKAKLAIRADRGMGRHKTCPSCANPKMVVVKFVRQSRASGLYWLCDKCNFEEPTK